MTVSQITTVIGAAASLLCTAAIGALAYFIKRVLSGLEEADKKNAERISQVEEKTAERIAQVEAKSAERIAQAEERSAAQLAKLDERSTAQIEKVEEKLNDLKSDMPILYVLREDFFRTMSSVDGSFSNLNQKVDHIISLITAEKERKDHGISG